MQKALMIPNAEIKEIFETTVIRWFDDSAKKQNRQVLFDAVWSGNSEDLTREMNVLLRQVSAMLHCDRSTTGCTPKSMKMITIRFSAMAFRSSKSGVG